MKSSHQNRQHGANDPSDAFASSDKGTDSRPTWLGRGLWLAIVFGALTLITSVLWVEHATAQTVKIMETMQAEAPACDAEDCPFENPLRWQENSESLQLTIFGGYIDDEANRVVIGFPYATVLFPITLVYSATTMGDFQIGEVLSTRHGEILGIFELQSQRADSPWPADQEDVTQQSKLSEDWTLRLIYGECSTPVGCEFALYDEASMGCMWMNPETEEWETTKDTVDVDTNRLTCKSRTLGVHAVVARRAQTSGEVESPPVYLPVILGQAQ